MSFLYNLRNEIQKQMTVGTIIFSKYSFYIYKKNDLCKVGTVVYTNIDP